MLENSDAELKEAKALADEFEALEGRRPRMYLAGITSDDETHMKKILATIFADMGWDVDVGPDGDTPEGAAQDASDNDVHMVGFFFSNGEHETLFRELVEELEKAGRDDICAFAFGNIPKAEGEKLLADGAACVIGSGADIQEGCLALLRMMAASAREEAREG